MTIEFKRDVGRYNITDFVIVRVNSIDEEIDEEVALFYHDGAISLPDVGQTVKFGYNDDVEASLGTVEEDVSNSYEVVAIEYAYYLHEWVDEEDDEVDAMFEIIDVYVDGPVES